MKKTLIKQDRSNQGIVEKRLEIFHMVGPRLNDILCFFSYTGNWKDDWISFFDTNNVVDGIMVKEGYDALKACFRKDLRG